jgi:hypothetical protein
MRKTLVFEANVDAKDSNDIYDLYLVDIGDNEVQLIIFMKLLFTFVDGTDGAGKAVKWTEQEKKNFVVKWRSDVATAWTSKRYRKYKDIYISIHVSFDARIGNSFSKSHWQILVEKLPSGSTGKTSFVWRDQIGKKYDVQLDSQDNEKKTGLADGTQTGSIHEFGHMLGLGDEYTASASAAVKKDKKSIMNSGSTIRPRHYASLLEWAQKKLDKVRKQIELNKKEPKLWDQNTYRPQSAHHLV